MPRCVSSNLCALCFAGIVPSRPPLSGAYQRLANFLRVSKYAKVVNLFFPADSEPKQG